MLDLLPDLFDEFADQLYLAKQPFQNFGKKLFNRAQYSQIPY